MLINRHPAGYFSVYLLNMLHFDMQNLYFLDHRHPVSTDKLLLFSLVAFWLPLLSHSGKLYRVPPPSDLVAGLGSDTIHPNKVGIKIFGLLVLVVHSFYSLILSRFSTKMQNQNSRMYIY